MLAAAGAHAGGAMEVGEEARASGWEEEGSSGRPRWGTGGWGCLPAAHAEQVDDPSADEYLPAKRPARR